MRRRFGQERAFLERVDVRAPAEWVALHPGGEVIDLWPNQRLVFLVLDMLTDRHR